MPEKHKALGSLARTIGWDSFEAPRTGEMEYRRELSFVHSITLLVDSLCRYQSSGSRMQ